MSKLAHSETNGVYVGVAELVDVLGSKSKNGKKELEPTLPTRGNFTTSPRVFSGKMIDTRRFTLKEKTLLVLWQRHRTGLGFSRDSG